jgi:5-methylcytosine-specific restriction endonuclease McrA
MKTYEMRPCANCGGFMLATSSIKVYCSAICREITGTTRYMRRTQLDGRSRDPDVHYAVQVRLAMIAGGGYDQYSRRLTPRQRAEVFERFGGRCAPCGDRGTEIDHIAGPSSDPSNLQLLCWSCHQAKTSAGFVPASHDVILDVFAPILARADCRHPFQPSDALNWDRARWGVLPLEDPDAIAKWREVVRRDFHKGGEAPPVKVGARGFPVDLMPWSWYGS